MKKLIEQTYDSTVSSFGLVLISIPLVAHLLLLEMSYHLKFILNDTSLIAPFTLLLLVRELLPVLVVILLVGNLAASFSAKIATLKMTEQLEAYELLGISWKKEFVYPTIISFCIANVFFLVFSFWFSLFIQGIFNPFGVSLEKFLNQSWLLIRMVDFGNAGVKALCFGALSPYVAYREGVRSRGGAKGVGDAATQTVVKCSVLIIVLDLIVDLLFSYIE